MCVIVIEEYERNNNRTYFGIYLHELNYVIVEDMYARIYSAYNQIMDYVGNLVQRYE